MNATHEWRKLINIQCFLSDHLDLRALTHRENNAYKVIYIQDKYQY